jgi:hypothetical protein
VARYDQVRDYSLHEAFGRSWHVETKLGISLHEAFGRSWHVETKLGITVFMKHLVVRGPLKPG